MTQFTSQKPRARLIGWLERKNDDFPYYNGNPTEISGFRWLIVLAGVVAGYFALINTQPLFPTGLAGFIPAILYSAVPLTVLAWASSGHWKALFRSVRSIDFAWIILFFVLNWIVTIVLGTIILALLDGTANPAGQIVASASGTEKVLFFLKSAVQLLGEEIFTVLPFLALFWFLVVHAGLSRGPAIALAALGASCIFASAHLPTYNWNVPQAFVGLVPIRIVLLLPYIITKNIWVSTGAHILNDWAIFGLPLLIEGGDTG